MARVYTYSIVHIGGGIISVRTEYRKRRPCDAGCGKLTCKPGFTPYCSDVCEDADLPF